MSHSSSVFNRMPIDLPNRSGFNLDHENQFSATCGTLIPAYAKPVLPKDTISMGVNFQCQLPPMVSDFAGKVDAVFEAFFVPNRILWGGWEDFVTHPTQRPVYPSGTPVQNRPSRKPTVKMFTDDQTAQLALGPASLADYLGWKKEDYTVGVEGDVDALPFLAYAMIYEHWYRDSRIQSPLFFPPASSDQSSQRRPACAPYVSIASTTNLAGPNYNVVYATYGDGSRIGDLRQRNWSKGYFTTASPLPQAGEAAEVTFDVANDQGAISIAALRSANSIQKWMERNNFSYEYADQIYAQYGIYPESAKMDKPIFLGRVKETVYTRSVMQSTPGTNTAVGKIPGWSNQLASKGGSSQAIGEGRLFQNFTPSEHGFLFVIFSLVPHAYYGTGCARHLIELDSEDIPFPLLAGMGDQPIYKWELTGTQPSETGDIFGYTDRYAHYKYDEDEVHGLLRDGQNLASLALQRGFAGADDNLELSSEFLAIPTDALDQVQAVSTSELGYSCIVNSFFKMEKISTLPAYSLPTLGDLKNTHTGYVSRGGSRL